MKRSKFQFWDEFKKKSKKNLNLEHLAIIIYKQDEPDLIDWFFPSTELGIKTFQNSIVFPKELLLALINSCIEIKVNPIIVHSHPFFYSKNDISFSNNDVDFMNKFVESARLKNFEEEIKFWVTNFYYYSEAIYQKEMQREKIAIRKFRIPSE